MCLESPGPSGSVSGNCSPPCTATQVKQELHEWQEIPPPHTQVHACHGRPRPLSLFVCICASVHAHVFTYHFLQLRAEVDQLPATGPHLGGLVIGKVVHGERQSFYAWEYTHIHTHTTTISPLPSQPQHIRDDAIKTLEKGLGWVGTHPKGTGVTSKQAGAVGAGPTRVGA